VIDPRADDRWQTRARSENEMHDAPAGRIGDAREIGRVAVFLASDDASFVNGIELFVDGGMAQI
jgi:NAD(P)-dependent dehydrogenase (short-subunit alcohol dehydrogenase family)